MVSVRLKAELFPVHFVCYICMICMTEGGFNALLIIHLWWKGRPQPTGFSLGICCPLPFSLLRLLGFTPVFILIEDNSIHISRRAIHVQALQRRIVRAQQRVENRGL